MYRKILYLNKILGYTNLRRCPPHSPPCAVVPLRCECHSHVKCQMMIRAVPYTHTTPNNPTVPSQPNPALVVSNTLKNDTLPTGLLVHTYIVPTPHGGNWAVCKNRGWPVGPRYLRYPSSCFRFHRTLHAFGQMIALPWSTVVGSGAAHARGRC